MGKKKPVCALLFFVVVVFALFADGVAAEDTAGLSRLYEVTIEVVHKAPTRGVCISPLWFGLHAGRFDLFDIKRPVSPALEPLVEDGDVQPLRDVFARVRGAYVDGVVKRHNRGGPLCRGRSAEATVYLSFVQGTKVYLSYAAMILPSNDAFVANPSPRDLLLVDESGQFRLEPFTVFGSDVLDAGTEVNDEDPRTTPLLRPNVRPNAGVDEEGVVGKHPGFLPPGSGGVLDVRYFKEADFLAGNEYPIVSIKTTATQLNQCLRAELAPMHDNEALKEAEGAVRICINGDDRSISCEVRIVNLERPIGADLFLQGVTQKSDETETDTKRASLYRVFRPEDTVKGQMSLELKNEIEDGFLRRQFGNVEFIGAANEGRAYVIVSSAKFGKGALRGDFKITTGNDEKEDEGEPPTSSGTDQAGHKVETQSEDLCTLCADGEPVREEYLDHFAVVGRNGEDLTCRDLERNMANFVDSCTSLQVVGALNCGCQPTPHPDVSCWLCPNGEVIPPEYRDKVLDVPSSIPDMNVTCQSIFLQATMPEITSTEATCKFLVHRFSDACGCFANERDEYEFFTRH